MMGVTWSALFIGSLSIAALVIWFIAEHRGWFMTEAKSETSEKMEEV